MKKSATHAVMGNALFCDTCLILKFYFFQFFYNFLLVRLE